ncbi:MAG TPA: hypothetical protein VF062_24905 [Candidatus Limnocylindrales bacterium]
MAPELANNDDAAKIREAEKDKLCPPNRNPQQPAIVVATGDSITSAHIQLNHYHVPRKCAEKQNTASDHRNLPGNDMVRSYVGKYVNTINREVVDYYNFARTDMATGHILTATPDFQDGCENEWKRAFPPIQMAEAVIAKGKRDGRRVLSVTTGGINNTNWSQVAAGVATCGMVELIRRIAAADFARRNTPFNALVRYYDTKGKRIERPDLIKGGSCQLVVQEEITGDKPRDITVERLRFVVPAFNGPDHLAQITRDVNTITTRLVAAGADKVVWMGYYDLTPAKIRLGTFASQYIQNTELPKLVKGALPDIPNVEAELVPFDDWKTQVKAWTADLNRAIKASILPNDPIVRFQPAPVLDADKIQRTLIGGCPHPNDPGHEALARALDTAIKA